MATYGIKKKSKKLPIESRVTKILVNKSITVYIDEWYLEELVDIIKEYPDKKYTALIKEMMAVNKRKLESSFPQSNLLSHKIVEKNSNFYEFHSMEEYVKETWFSSEKISLLKINSTKKMHVKLSTVGGVPHIPSFLNNLSPNNMLSFEKEKSIKFKKATILINFGGYMNWKDYKKIIRNFFRQYDFESLSVGNISHTRERSIDYYRITLVKVRNGVNINGQGLMFESADFLRRIMFMIYEIDPTPQIWKSYGQTVLNEDIEALKIREPYFASILLKYLNPSIILVE